MERIAGRPRRRPCRWTVAGGRTRYHLTAVPFKLRSKQARRHVAARRGGIRHGVQVGSTFDSRGPEGIPCVLCCDSNIGVAAQGQSTGFSDAAALTPADIDAIRRRETDVYRGAAAMFR